MKTPDDFTDDLENVGQIAAVPTILDVVCRTTGMGFAAVARVTENRWIACSVLDAIDFGLGPGGELKVETTICHEIRQSREAVVIDNVQEDARWCDHHTPATYGFQSYISVPIILNDGSFFGTLCAIDPRPSQVNRPEVIEMFQLFSQLIAKHLDERRKLATAEAALADERETGELREQFIAVLGHDLRNPLRGVRAFAELLLKKPLDEQTYDYASLIRDSAVRMQALIENLLDLARGRMGGGLPVRRETTVNLEATLNSIVTECDAAYPGRVIRTNFSLRQPIFCDTNRIAQLFTNLLTNALIHGALDQPIRVEAITCDGVFQLSIANAGEPIPSSALERLFRPFHRNSVRSDAGGLGLGLYIAHAVATAHGGTLTVQSGRDETRFTFRMPTGQDASSDRVQALSYTA